MSVSNSIGLFNPHPEWREGCVDKFKFTDIEPLQKASFTTLISMAQEQGFSYYLMAHVVSINGENPKRFHHLYDGIKLSKLKSYHFLLSGLDEESIYQAPEGKPTVLKVVYLAVSLFNVDGKKNKDYRLQPFLPQFSISYPNGSISYPEELLEGINALIYYNQNEPTLKKIDETSLKQVVERQARFTDFHLPETCERVWWLRQAIKMENTYAQALLGAYYLYCTSDSSNAKEAVELSRAAAKKGHFGAQYNYGRCLELGYGIKKPDLEKAFKYYTRSAHNRYDDVHEGYDEAQWRLGVCYEQGIGVKVDLTQAAYFYKLAAAQNLPKALFAIGNCFEYARGINMSLSNALFSYEKAFELEVEADAKRECELAINRVKNGNSSKSTTSTLGRTEEVKKEKKEESKLEEKGERWADKPDENRWANRADEKRGGTVGKPPKTSKISLLSSSSSSSDSSSSSSSSSTPKKTSKPVVPPKRKSIGLHQLPRDRTHW